MYESFFIVSCQNFQIMQVTNSKSFEPLPFLCSEKEALFLPKDMSAVHIDYTEYYFMGSTDMLGMVFLYLSEN